MPISQVWNIYRMLLSSDNFLCLRFASRDINFTASQALHTYVYVMAGDPDLPDQKTRTMEALERRFALAEAQHFRQQPNYKKRPHEEDSKVVLNVDSPSVSLIKPCTNPPANKGHFASARHSATQDAEANGPTYFQLSHPVHDKLLPNSSEMSNRSKTVVNTVLHELLQSGDSAEKYLQGSKTKRVDNWILLNNLDKGHGASLAACMRALQKHSKRSKKHMSMKQLKKSGAFDLSQELHNFDYFKPMHEMWKGYISKLIKNVGKNQLAQSLLSADLHGAVLLVVHCKVDSYTGLSGIMIRETADTFGIITHDNKFRVVPKKQSVFILQVDCWKITLQGDKLASRNLGS